MVSLRQPTVIIPASIHRTMLFPAGSKQVLLTFAEQADKTMKVVEMEQLDEGVLTRRQVETLQKRHDLGDFDKPLNTPPEFETALAKEINIDFTRRRSTVWLLIRILRRYHQAFSFKGNELGKYTAIPFKITPKDERMIPPSPPPRRYSPKKVELIRQFMDKMLKLGRYTPLFEVPRYVSDLAVVEYDDPNKDTRVCGDYRVVNQITQGDPYPFPPMTEVLNWITRQPLRFVSGGDNNKGFYQIIINDDNTRKLLSIRILNQIYMPNFMPFGPKQAPQHFLRAHDQTYGDIKYKVMINFMDDTHIPSNDPYQQLEAVAAWLKRTVDNGWTLKIRKCQFLLRYFQGLGFYADHNGVRADPERIKAILELQPPVNLSQLWSFWGLLIFFSVCINDLSSRFCLFRMLIGSGLEKYTVL